METTTTTTTTNPVGAVSDTLPATYVEGGIYYDVPDAEYRKAAGVSCSMLKALRKRWSPKQARAYLAMPQEMNDAMLFGMALHAAVLTPELPPIWALAPKGMSFRTNAGKEWREGTLRANKVPLSCEEGVRLHRTLEALSGHAMVQAALKEAKREVSVFAPFDLGGRVLRKGRMDAVSPGIAIIDLKSSVDVSPKCLGKRDKFGDAIVNYDYDMQAAYYLDLWNAACFCPSDRKAKFVFIAVDYDYDTQVCGVRVLTAAEEVIRSGRDKYLEALGYWIRCDQEGLWGQAYPADIEPIGLPEYAARKYREGMAMNAFGGVA